MNEPKSQSHRSGRSTGWNLLWEELLGQWIYCKRGGSFHVRLWGAQSWKRSRMNLDPQQKQSAVHASPSADHWGAH